MARSKSTEWVVPRSYGVQQTIAAGVTSDIRILDVEDVFDPYGTDEVTLLALKGHVVYEQATGALPEPNGWRIRMALENLTTNGITNTGSLTSATTAEEHFLTERWFLLDGPDLVATNPYFLKIDVTNKRIVRRGQALVFSNHYFSPDGTIQFRLWLRALVLL